MTTPQDTHMEPGEMLARLRHVLADVQAKGRHARESAEALRSRHRSILDVNPIQLSAYEAGARWADDHAAALEQAIQVMEVLTHERMAAFQRFRIDSDVNGSVTYYTDPTTTVYLLPDCGPLEGDTTLGALLKAHAALYPSTTSPEKGEDK